MKVRQGGCGGMVSVFLLVAILALVAFIKVGFAHDPEHPEEDAWYAALMQPDAPSVSCCGKADAYWCDSPHTRDGRNYCTISDDRVVMNRTPRPVGMEIEIPNKKMMDGHITRGNPTGHDVVFLTSGEVPSVYCYVMTSGI